MRLLVFVAEVVGRVFVEHDHAAVHGHDPRERPGNAGGERRVVFELNVVALAQREAPLAPVAHDDDAPPLTSHGELGKLLMSLSLRRVGVAHAIRVVSDPPGVRRLRSLSVRPTGRPWFLTSATNGS